MKIAITGGAGFIGSHTAERLAKEHEIFVIDNFSSNVDNELSKYPNVKINKIDICDDDAINTCFVNEKFDVVYHLAAQMNVRKSLVDPRFDAENNIVGSISILNACRQNNVKKVIFASSGGTVYGEATVIPTPIEYPLFPQCPYGIAKLAVEHYIRFYRETYGMKIYILRYANVFGPRQRPESDAGVVSIFINNFLHNRHSIIFGDGRQTRDYVYITDVVDANESMLKYDGNDYIFNIGTGIETNVNVLYRHIEYIMEKDFAIEYKDKRQGELQRSALDIKKTTEILGWTPKITAYNGLTLTAKYFSKRLEKQKR